MNPLNHVAIIMDGNGRWGLKHKKSRNAGHKAGLKTVEKVIKESEFLDWILNSNLNYFTNIRMQLQSVIRNSLKPPHVIKPIQSSGFQALNKR